MRKLLVCGAAARVQLDYFPVGTCGEECRDRLERLKLEETCAAGSGSRF